MKRSGIHLPAKNKFGNIIFESPGKLLRLLEAGTPRNEMPVERGAIGIAGTTMITHPENVFIIKNLSQIFSISPETAHRGVLDERAHQNIYL